jgi:glycerol transport system permease protein
MAPPAVFALPFFQLYSAVGLFDTHIAVALAHCLFNVPLAVWILEGFMRGVPKEIDETAYHRRLFLAALLREDLHADDLLGHRRRGVLLLHVQLGGAAAVAHADLRRRQADRGDDDAHGLALPASTGGVLAAAGVLTIIPGALVIWFVRNYIAKGFALGRV